MYMTKHKTNGNFFSGSFCARERIFPYVKNERKLLGSMEARDAYIHTGKLLVFGFPIQFSYSMYIEIDIIFTRHQCIGGIWCRWQCERQLTHTNTRTLFPQDIFNQKHADRFYGFFSFVFSHSKQKTIVTHDKSAFIIVQEPSDFWQTISTEAEAAAAAAAFAFDIISIFCVLFVLPVDLLTRRIGCDPKTETKKKRTQAKYFFVSANETQWQMRKQTN